MAAHRALPSIVATAVMLCLAAAPVADSAATVGEHPSEHPSIDPSTLGGDVARALDHEAWARLQARLTLNF
jgi:hypothetical protein